MIYFIIYILCGFIIGGYMWHRICLKQTEEEKYEENPSVIIFLLSLILFWPIGLISFINGKMHNKI